MAQLLHKFLSRFGTVSHQKHEHYKESILSVIVRLRKTFFHTKQTWTFLRPVSHPVPVFLKKTFFIALIAGVAHPCFGEDVRSLVGVPVEQIPSKEIRESLEKGMDRWVDPSKHSALPKISDKLVEVVQSIWKKSDGDKPIYVFITDDLYPNAFARGEKDATYVGVSLGLLDFVENDAELKFAIGQQLEKSKSKVKAYKEAKYGKTPEALDLIDTVLWHQLDAAEEVESDIRSVVERMIDKGENPYPAEDFLLRWEKQVRGIRRDRTPMRAGDSTKRQALGMAIAALGRGLGRYISKNPPKNEVAQLADEYLRSDEFKRDRETKLAEAFRYQIPGVQQLYWDIESGNTGHWDPDTVGSLYERVYDWRWKWLARYIKPHKLDDETLIDHQLKLHASVSEQFDQAREQALGKDFQASSIEALDLLTRIDSREYRNGMYPDLSSRFPYVADVLGELEKSGNKLKEARRQNRPVDTIDELREKVRAAKSKYDTLIQMHDTDVPALAREGLTLRRQTRPGTLIPSRAFEITRELEESQRYAGPYIAKTRRRREATAEQGLSLLLEEVGRSLEHAEVAQEVFARMGPKVKDENWQKFLNAAVEGFEEDLKRSQTKSEVDDAFRSVMEFLHLEMALSDIPYERLFNDRSSQGSVLFRKVLGLGLDHAKTPDQVMRFFPKELFEGAISTGSQAETPNFGVTPQIMDKILDNQLLEKLFEATGRSLSESESISVADSEDLKELVRALKGIEGSINQLNAWEKRRLINSEPFKDRLRPSAQSFIETVTKHLRELELAQPPEKVIRSVLTVRFPSILKLLGRAPTDNPDDLMRDIRALAKDSWTQDAFAEQFGFNELAKAGLRSRSGLGALVHSRKEKARFFQFISDVGPLVGLGKRKVHRLEDKSDFIHSRKLKEAFGMYCLKHCPGKNDLVHRVTSEFKELMDEFDPEKYQNAFMQRLGRIKYQQAKKQHRRTTGTQHYEATMTTYKKLTEGLPISEDVLIQNAPKKPSERVKYLIGLGNAAGLAEHKKRTTKSNLALFPDTAQKVIDALSEEKLDFHKVDTPSLIDYFTSEHLNTDPSPQRDALFELIRERTENKPELRKKLFQPRLVETLRFEENREWLAKQQLDHLLNLDQESRLIRSEPRRTTTDLREVIQKTKQVLDQQYPKSDPRKDRLIDYVEKRLQTTPDESDFLDCCRVNHDNWVESPLLNAFQIPEFISSRMDSNQDRLELLEYVLQKRSAFPDFVNRMEGFDEYIKRTKIEPALKVMQRSFEETNVHARTYALLPLLDHEGGILGNERTRERVMELMLGDYANEPVYRALVEAYLSSSELSDQRVVISHVLSSGLRRKKDGKLSFVRDVLEGMGPFGIRAGQFIRANGLGSPELLRELDHFFDNALPPNRRKQIEDARKIFGDNIKNVRILDLKGSGALNYVMEAEIQEGTATPRRIAIRIQRDNVSERIANENRIWERAIDILRDNPDPKVKKHASLVDEARVESMHTLREGGAELNLAIERQAVDIAKKAYDFTADSETGFHTRAVTPIDDLQMAVPKELQTKVSIYEVIDAVPLKEVKDPKLRAKLSKQIIETEFRALFELNIFDPDGHPGNWLVDLKNKALVRVDYAQIKQPPAEEVEAIKNVLDLTLMPYLGEEWKNTIYQEFDKLFSIEETGGKTIPKEFIEKTIENLLKYSQFPPQSEPANRLFHLRQHLEQAIEAHFDIPNVRVRLHPTTRAALGSLSRLQSYIPHLPKALWNQISHRRIMAKRFNIKPGKYAVSQIKRITADCFKRLKRLRQQEDFSMAP